ncbi:MAG TPA: homoserine kinase [Actinomycetota bacterium]|jgi:homoserine kinase|nr:homoserine kinase [Actinomycetota bacterium]
MEPTIRVRAPATSANLGPAFDAAGIALDWWDELEVRPAPVDAIQVSGEQAELLPTGRDNLVAVAMRRLAEAAGAPLPPLHLTVVKGFPLGRGFGSSAAAVVLGLVAARRLVAPELPDTELLALACELEGHPDNATPCLQGGATLAWVEDGRPRWRAVPVHPDLVAVALVAPEPMATSEARRLLPERVPFAVAAHTGARSAMLPLALAGDTDLLLPATEDLLHQPQRLAQAPDSARLLERLRTAGHAGFVSGAGPSLLVLCPRPAAPGVLADAEAAVAAGGDEGWRIRPLELARHGAR